jgi:hypothetical protein
LADRVFDLGLSGTSPLEERAARRRRIERVIYFIGYLLLGVPLAIWLFRPSVAAVEGYVLVMIFWPVVLVRAVFIAAEIDREKRARAVSSEQTRTYNKGK